MFIAPIDMGVIRVIKQYPNEKNINLLCNFVSDTVASKTFDFDLIGVLKRVTFYGENFTNVTVKLLDNFGCDLLQGNLVNLTSSRIDIPVYKNVIGVNQFPVYLCGKYTLYIESNTNTIGQCILYIEKLECSNVLL